MFTYKHSSSKIELMEELSDKNVDLEYARHVFLLHVTQHVDKPLEVPV